MAVHLAPRRVCPVSGPAVDGCRQFLFRRSDVAAINPARLISGASKRARAPHAAPALWRRLGRAVQAAFGDGLAKKWRTFRDAERGIVVRR